MKRVPQFVRKRARLFQCLNERQAKDAGSNKGQQTVYTTIAHLQNPKDERQQRKAMAVFRHGESYFPHRHRVAGIEHRHTGEKTERGEDGWRVFDDRERVDVFKKSGTLSQSSGV